MSTIFALSTPPGKSGVAVLRISGPEALKAIASLGVEVPAARHATLAMLRTAHHDIIDSALVLYFPAPHSFTGEDIVELHTHGSRAVIRRITDYFLSLSFLRPAEAGEFTRRAFLNGKMDLTAAEGLADLLDAETESQRKQALRQMQGEATQFYDTIRAQILHALAYLEAYIDFPDEEIPNSVLKEVTDAITDLQTAIKAKLDDKGIAEKIREGVQVAILGHPNVGKSSFLNLLAGRDVAIVSHIPGTTRDALEVHLDIDGYAVILCDTAGIHASDDDIEQEGIRRSFARAGVADLRIIMIDTTDPDALDPEIAALIDANTLILHNKTDLASMNPLALGSACAQLGISVAKRQGIDDVITYVKTFIHERFTGEGALVTRSRHRHHLQEALLYLAGYQNREQEQAGLEIRCEELRQAAQAIGAITGRILPDDVLGHIFSRFCIGK